MSGISAIVFAAGAGVFVAGLWVGYKVRGLVERRRPRN